jgi:beta-1,4-N-acetylglucosaminyltransferase
MVIVLGSGGHTAEMMSLMRDINPTRCQHRTYIVSSGDSFSSSKAVEIEKRVQANHTATGSAVTSKGHYDSTLGIWDVRTVPRARKIHQSLLTAPFSSLWCLLGCLKALYMIAKDSKVSPGKFPDVIATNGPATAVIFIFAAIILKFFGIAPLSKMKIIYVESWARVVSLSLSGKILLKLGICEKFIVQWEVLAKAINGPEGRGRVEWRGFLVE